MFFAIDQYSKYLILKVVEAGNIPININKFLNLIAVKNTGFSFGLLSDYGLNQNMTAIFTLAVLVIVSYYVRKIPPFIQGLIIGGALGNIWDRFSQGGVLDFIDLHIANWHYPTFNLADSFIVIAVIYIIINEMIVNHKNIKHKK